MSWGARGARSAATPSGRCGPTSRSSGAGAPSAGLTGDCRRRPETVAGLRGCDGGACALRPPSAATSRASSRHTGRWGLEKTLQEPAGAPRAQAHAPEEGAPTDSRRTGLTWPLRQRLMAAAGDRLLDDRNRALLAVAYDTMLRRAELVPPCKSPICLKEIGGDDRECPGASAPRPIARAGARSSGSGGTA